MWGDPGLAGDNFIGVGEVGTQAPCPHIFDQDGSGKADLTPSPVSVTLELLINRQRTLKPQIRGLTTVE